MVQKKVSFRNVLILVLISLIIVLWVGVNNPVYLSASIIYLMFVLVALFFYASKTIFSKSLIGINSLGFDKNFFIGLGVGLFFVFLSVVNSVFALSLPGAFLSLGGVTRFLIVGLVAPITEEVFFRGVLFSLFEKFFRINGFLTIFLTSVLFSVFHLLAYGSSVGVLGAFVSAIIFGFVAGLLRKYTGGLKAGIITHIIFNTFLLFSLSVVIA